MRGLCVLLFLVLLRPSVGAEPEYQGKPAKYWLTQAASKSPKDRRNAIEALTALGEPVAVAGLLGDSDVDVRSAAAIALYKSDGRAVPTLIADAKRAWPRGSASMDGLVAIGQGAVPDLIKVLHDGKESRLALMGASLTLGRIGPPAKAAISDLAKIGRIRDYDLWPGPAIYALAQIDTEGKTAVPVIAEAMESWEYGVRAWAQRSLYTIGPMAIPLLIDVLQSKEAVGREGAVKALEYFGPQAKTAIPALKQALSDKDKSLRSAAERAIKEIDQSPEKPESSDRH